MCTPDFRFPKITRDFQKLLEIFKDYLYNKKYKINIHWGSVWFYNKICYS